MEIENGSQQAHCQGVKTEDRVAERTTRHCFECFLIKIKRIALHTLYWVSCPFGESGALHATVILVMFLDKDLTLTGALGSPSAVLLSTATDLLPQPPSLTASDLA